MPHEDADHFMSGAEQQVRSNAAIDPSRHG
jgi:hypothetical protein